MTAFYPFNGVPVAMKKNGTLYYLHRDHLGSLVSATKSDGTEQFSVRYAPFGGIRSSTGTLVTDRLFTGQIRDLGDDRFYFFKARYYDATIGKFQTADMIAPEPGRPRTLNRYAYGANDPMRFNNPSGHRYDDPSDGGYSTEPLSLASSIVLDYQSAAANTPPSLADNESVTDPAPMAPGFSGGTDRFDKRTNFGATDTPRESIANVAAGTVTGQLAGGTTEKLVRVQNFRSPEHFGMTKVGTGVARGARIAGALVGAGFLAYDEVNLYQQRQNGSISSDVYTQEAIVAAVGGGAAIALGFILPVVPAVIVGVALVAAVGAVDQGIKTGNWTPANLEQGAISSFLPLF